MTNEEAFRRGAAAMQSEIAVRLITGGTPAGRIVAPVVLGYPLPKFQIPETWVIEGKESP